MGLNIKHYRNVLTCKKILLLFSHELSEVSQTAELDKILANGELSDADSEESTERGDMYSIIITRAL